MTHAEPASGRGGDPDQRGARRDRVDRPGPVPPTAVSNSLKSVCHTQLLRVGAATNVARRRTGSRRPPRRRARRTLLALTLQWDDTFGLGLHYMHARHYAPVLGRFLQPDPESLDGSHYGYTANNPATAIDPLGLCTSCYRMKEGYTKVAQSCRQWGRQEAACWANLRAVARAHALDQCLSRFWEGAFRVAAGSVWLYILRKRSMVYVPGNQRPWHRPMGTAWVVKGIDMVYQSVTC